jgi:hypothetical protein
MSIKSILKRVSRALPVILAAAPGVLDAVNQVREALKKPKAPAGNGGGAESGGAPAAAGTIER